MNNETRLKIYIAVVCISCFLLGLIVGSEKVWYEKNIKNIIKMNRNIFVGICMAEGILMITLAVKYILLYF